MSEEMTTPVVEEAIADTQPIDESSGIDEVNEADMDPSLPQEPSEVQAETVEELQEEVENAIDNGATEEQVEDMVREFELKVKGKKKKVKIDLNDEQDLVRRLQMAEAGQLAMQETAELKKLYEQEINRFRENPWKFMEEQGIDPDEAAEQRLIQKMEELKKSPEQIERERLQKELEVARAELKRREQEAEEAIRIQRQEQAAVDLDREITEALAQNPNLPKTRKTVSRIADALMWAMDNGYEDISVADVIPSVEAEIRAELNELMSELPEEMMESYIGKKNIERLRKKRLAQAKTAQTQKIQAVTKPKVEQEDKSEPISTKDFFRSLR